MNNYNGLWQAIKKRVCSNKQLPEHQLLTVSSAESTKVYLRILQIFALECILHAYRLKYATPFCPLEGKKALHHMIFRKTNWHPDTIRRLSLSDSLFLVNEELSLFRLPSDVQVFIQLPDNGLKAHSLDAFPDEDWLPAENAVFLKDPGYIQVV
jgi:hypothetical protein